MDAITRLQPQIRACSHLTPYPTLGTGVLEDVQACNDFWTNMATSTAVHIGMHIKKILHALAHRHLHGHFHKKNPNSSFLPLECKLNCNLLENELNSYETHVHLQIATLIKSVEPSSINP